MTISSESKYALTKAAFIFSPVLVAEIMSRYYMAVYRVPYGNEGNGLMFILAWLLEVPAILVIGAFFSFLTRRRLKAERLSIYSYVVSAVIVNGYFLIGRNIPISPNLTAWFFHVYQFIVPN